MKRTRALGAGVIRNLGSSPGLVVYAGGKLFSYLFGVVWPIILSVP